jgi:hypothetical protein
MRAEIPERPAGLDQQHLVIAERLRARWRGTTARRVPHGSYFFLSVTCIACSS